MSTQQVFVRYILNFSFQWSEEFPVLLFAWLVFLGSAGALAEGRHLGVKFIQEWLPSGCRRGVRFLVHLSILAFLVFCVIAGVQLTRVFGHYSFVALPISRYWFFLAVPVGCLLMLPAGIRILVAEWRRKSPFKASATEVQGQLS